MQYVEALDTRLSKSPHEKWLFLAGGINGCEDWQAEMRSKLEDVINLILFNPRRADFPINDPSAAVDQIGWEWKHLKLADAISFWFTKDTIQPITLFELGRWSTPHKPAIKPFANDSLKIDVEPKPIFVGVDANYPRRLDIAIQLSLERPGLKVVYSLADLACQIKEWVNARN